MENAGKKCPMCQCTKCECIKMLIPVVIGFVYIFILEFILHGVLLKSQYEATAHLWRSPEDMQAMFPFMLLTQFLTAFITAFIFTRHYKGKGIGEGLRYGKFIGLLIGVLNIAPYAWTPVPAMLAMAWFAGGFLKGIGLGALFGLIAEKCCKGDSSCGTGSGKSCG